MLDNSFTEALGLVCSMLGTKKVKWALIGSANMALQGINIRPNDLDLATDINNLPLCANVFKEYLEEPPVKIPSSDGFPEYYKLKLLIKGVYVEVCCRHDDVYGSKLKEGRVIFVDMGRFKIPCLCLDAEAEACLELGKDIKVSMIKEFLKNKT